MTLFAFYHSGRVDWNLGFGSKPKSVKELQFYRWMGKSGTEFGRDGAAGRLVFFRTAKDAKAAKLFVRIGWREKTLALRFAQRGKNHCRDQVAPQADWFLPAAARQAKKSFFVSFASSMRRHVKRPFTDILFFHRGSDCHASIRTLLWACISPGAC